MIRKRRSVIIADIVNQIEDELALLRLDSNVTGIDEEINFLTDKVQKLFMYEEEQKMAMHLLGLEYTV